MKKNCLLQLSVTIIFMLLMTGSAKGQTGNLPIAEGPYKPTDESINQFRYPEWFRDAKFGIWAHWGPQAVPRKGDYDNVDTK